jgi:putative ABC transport system ATP-binding protein
LKVRFDLNEETIHLDSVRFYWSKVADFKIYIPKLEIGRGEKVLLLGESGSGKTTLLSLICGFLSPISGDIFLNEQKLNDLKANKKDQFRSDNIGIIFQQFNLLPYANVIDNITLPLYFSKNRDSRVTNHRETALNLCRSLQLSESTIAMQANKLSVGQQQRVAVARALIGNPSLIIADEPTSSLDASTQKKFLDLMFRQIEEHKSTLLMVSHDSSISNYFDRTINIKDILVREN